MVKLSKSRLHKILMESIDKVLGNENSTQSNVENNTATTEQHQTMMDAMTPFLDNGQQKVGIFWYDIGNQVLFGVEKDDAEKYVKEKGDGTFNKLHKTYWQKQHHRAVAKGLTSSIFYIESNYTLIPRGRVFVRPNGTCYVATGKWINGVINGQNVLDPQKVKELIADEFNLPDDFEIVYDPHWDIGHGWSGDVIR